MQVTVSVPATSANLGPGFDAVGIALQLHNRFTFAECDDDLQISVSGEGQSIITCDESNLVYQVATGLFETVDFRPKGLLIHIDNSVPAASGMGSSSTAIVGGLLGANALAGYPLDEADLLQKACQIEGHPDNVMPALLGGFTLGVLDGDKVVAERIELPPMKVVIVLPDFPTLTKEARAILPSAIPMADAIHNLSRTALLTQAFARADFTHLRIAMQDRMHQPYRVPLIPGFAEAMAAAYDAGALGVAQSGAGPSMIAIADDDHGAIAAAIVAAFAAHGLEARSWVLDVDNAGAQIAAE